jgi:hypothetical protein
MGAAAVGESEAPRSRAAAQRDILQAGGGGRSRSGAGRRCRVPAQHRRSRGLDRCDVCADRGPPRPDRRRRLAHPPGSPGVVGQRDGDRPCRRADRCGACAPDRPDQSCRAAGRGDSHRGGAGPQDQPRRPGRAREDEGGDRALERAPDEAFAIESECTKENAKTEDAKEGPRAFMEKRDPVFRGR